MSLDGPHVALDHLTTEALNPASEGLDGLSSLEFVRVMNSEDARVAEAVGREAESIAKAVDAAAERLQRGGRIVYIGAGTSGRLGVLDAAECPPNLQHRPVAGRGRHRGRPRRAHLGDRRGRGRPRPRCQGPGRHPPRPDDMLVGIATSGRTPYVIGGLCYAQGVGAYTVALSCNADAEIDAYAHLAITPVVGPEVLSGSTRLKAGTATKFVLNMITTGAMVRLGKTFGNLMIDLRPTNSKLMSRSVRIVRLATGLEYNEAYALLESCKGEVKLAIVANLTGATPDEARSASTPPGACVEGDQRLASVSNAGRFSSRWRFCARSRELRR